MGVLDRLQSGEQALVPAFRAVEVLKFAEVELCRIAGPVVRRTGPAVSLPAVISSWDTLYRLSGISMLQSRDREGAVTKTNCFAVHHSAGNCFAVTIPVATCFPRNVFTPCRLTNSPLANAVFRLNQTTASASPHY